MQRRFYSILGNTQKLDGGAMFGNAPKAMWARWASVDDQNRIDLACRALLVKEPERNLLFEAGIGAFFTPHLRERYGVVEPEHVLVDNLKAVGMAVEDIDVIVLSHLHFDHAGGVLKAFEEGKSPELLFPNASYVVGKTAFERAKKPHPRDRASYIPELPALLEATGRLELVDGGTSETLGPDYRILQSDGHSPGMILSEVPTETGPMVFAADLVPGLAWVRGSITMGYDRYPELLIDEKRKLLAEVFERNGRLFFAHDPKYACCGLEKNERGQLVHKDPVETLANVA